MRGKTFGTVGDREGSSGETKSQNVEAHCGQVGPKGQVPWQVAVELGMRIPIAFWISCVASLFPELRETT